MQQQALAWRMAGDEIGFVPTMGALHAGHDSLVQRARRENQRVIASIFVNPRQFGPSEDFRTYPRPFETDRTRLEALGVDVIFHPADDQIYPASFRTAIDPGRLGAVLEGASRPGHFGGVLTIVLKLFELTRPTRAYFGLKDFQQIVLVRQLVRDFALPLRIVAVPTVREADGLAMSSRNVYLNPAQRAIAPQLHKALNSAVSAFNGGLSDPGELEAIVGRRLAVTPHLVIDYVAVIDETTLRRPERAQTGNVIAIAVKLGPTRLIDNAVLGAEHF